MYGGEVQCTVGGGGSDDVGAGRQAAFLASSA